MSDDAEGSMKPKLPYPLNFPDVYLKYYVGVGRLITDWAATETSITSAIEILWNGAGLRDQIMPWRVADRLKVFKELVHRHCKDASIIAELDYLLGTLGRLKEVRDDLMHNRAHLMPFDTPPCIVIFPKRLAANFPRMTPTG